YNELMNAWGQGINFGNFNPGGSNIHYVIRFNSIKDTGQGFPTTHGDWIQEFNDDTTHTTNIMNSYVFNFNLCYQTSQFGGGATQGLSLHSANLKQGYVQSGDV